MALVKSETPAGDKNKKPEGLSIEKQTELLERMELMSAKMDELDKKGSSGSGTEMKELVDALKHLKSGDGNNGKYDYDEVDSSGYLNPDKIDANDVLESGDVVRFYAYKSNYVIVDDLRQGRAVQTPFKNKILFDHMGTKTTGVGKFAETEHSCVYTCKSKKEAEWLKEHSLYGVVFFASGGNKTLMSVGAKKATKMASIMNSLKNQDRYSIINMCKQHGIDLMEDASDMRIALANKLADDVEVQESKMSEEAVKEMLLTKKDIAELN